MTDEDIYIYIYKREFLFGKYNREFLGGSGVNHSAVSSWNRMEMGNLNS